MTDGMPLLWNVKLAEPKEFMKVGEIGEFGGEYYRLDGINDLRHIAYFTPIKIRKLKLNYNGFVELDE